MSLYQTRKDDIDESADAQECRLSITVNGVTESYKIDLGAANLAKLNKALDPYKAAGEKVASATVKSSAGGKGGTRSPMLGVPASEYSSSEVKTWAQKNGFEVKERGRISKKQLSAYLKAEKPQVAEKYKVA